MREEILAGGESPLEFLMGLMRDEAEDKAVRIDAAKAAAPYLHAKLTSVDAEARVDVTGAINILTGVPRD
jgi:hypothetical protein